MSGKSTFSEIVYGGLWVASAIYVTGYTWSAMTGEYATFPGMGGGGGNTDPGSLVPEKKGQRIPLVGSGFLSLPWAQRALNNVLGNNPKDTKPLSPAEVKQNQRIAGVSRGGVVQPKRIQGN